MRQSDSVPPSLWPAAAAALSAWLGIGSAEYTYGAVGSAVVFLSLAIASLLFLVFMYFAPRAESTAADTRRIQLAAAGAWVASVYSTWLVEQQLHRTVGALSVTAFSLMLGAGFGAVFAVIVSAIGALPPRWPIGDRMTNAWATRRAPRYPRMTPFAHPTLAAAWPAIAAGVAALVGMNSCMVTMIPLTMFGAPIVAVIIAGGLFRLLLPLASVPAAADVRAARLRGAAGTAWVVSIATCWLIAARFSDVVVAGGGAPSDNGVASIGVITGVVLGGFVARKVLVVGRRYMGDAQRP
jgi:hypothetical protein